MAAEWSPVWERAVHLVCRVCLSYVCSMSILVKFPFWFLRAFLSFYYIILFYFIFFTFYLFIFYFYFFWGRGMRYAWLNSWSLPLCDFLPTIVRYVRLNASPLTLLASHVYVPASLYCTSVITSSWVFVMLRRPATPGIRFRLPPFFSQLTCKRK